MADDAHAEASERAIDAGMELEGRGDTAGARRAYELALAEGRLIADKEWGAALVEAALDMIKGLPPPPAGNRPPPPGSAGRPPPPQQQNDDALAARSEALIDEGMAHESAGNMAGAKAKYEEAQALARRITDPGPS